MDFEDDRSAENAWDWSCVSRWAVVAFLLLASSFAQAAEVQVGAAVERQEVYVGEGVVFQIIVQGSKNVTQPDLSAITDFTVTGGQVSDHSSESISIVNGQMSRTRVEKVAYNYRITAKKEGTFVIPSIDVKVDGKNFRTQPIQIHSKKAAETGEFKLRLQLPKKEVYVGEMIEAKLVWYIGQNVNNGFSFSVPLAADDRFDILAKPLDGVDQRSLVRTAVNGTEALLIKGEGTLDGTRFTTLTWHAYLIPREAGTLELPGSAVSFSAIVGYRERQRRDIFDGVFGNQRQAVTRDLTIGSGDTSLVVKALPDEGRPDDFGGLVGQFRLSVSANPLEVNVGDPITLSLALSGLPVMDHFELPPLKNQKPLAESFKIPDEREAGRVKGGNKFFAQTIRALSESVESIPELRLPFFNPESGSYQVASTAPIQIKVNETKVVTASDAEGVAAAEGSRGSEVKASGQGIAHNYEGLDVLENQDVAFSFTKSPLAATVLVGSPVTYVVIFAVVGYLRRRNSNPALVKSRAAMGEFKASLSGGDITPADVLEALCDYMGARLFLPPGVLTYKDVEPDLKQRKLSEADLKELKSIFEECEACRYAGASGVDAQALAQKALALGGKIEEVTR